MVRPEIEAIVSDLDDVWLRTNPWFLTHMRQAMAKIVADHNLDSAMATQLEARFSQLNIEAFAVAGVSRVRWQIIWEWLAAELPYLNPQLIAEALPIYQLIYQGAPELNPYARAVMGQLAQFGLPMALFTHADRSATQKKVRAHGLDHYFQPIRSHHPLQKKDARAWHRFIVDELGLLMERVLIVEDNGLNVNQVIAAGALPENVIQFCGSNCPSYGQNVPVPRKVARVTSLLALPYLVVA